LQHYHPAHNSLWRVLLSSPAMEALLSTHLRRFLASFRCASSVSVRKYRHITIATAETRRESRSVQNVSTPSESRGLRPRYEEPGPTPRTLDDATKSLIQGRDSEEIDNPCLVQVLLIRPLPRPPPWPPAEVRREGAVSAHAGRKRLSSKTICFTSRINYLPAESLL